MTDEKAPVVSANSGDTFSSTPAPSDPAVFCTAGEGESCKQLLARVIRLSQLYAGISEANGAILRATRIEDVYRTVCAACVRHCGYKLAWVGVHDPERGRIVPAEASGPAIEWIEGFAIDAGVGSASDGPCAEAFRQQRTCRMDISATSGLEPWQHALSARGLHYAIALPLRRGGAPFGTLAVYGDDSHFTDDETGSLLEEMAVCISFALDRFDREQRRGEAEAALRASEARLHEAQAVGGIGDWEFDCDSETLTWSPQLFHLFERPLDLGPPSPREPTDSYAHSPDTLARTRQKFEEAIATGEPREVEQDVRLPSGALRYHLTRIVPIKDETGRVRKLFGTVQDITDRKLVEQELLGKTREIEDLYQNAPCGYHSLDAEGRFIQINDTELRWLGYDRDEVVGKMRVVDILTPQDQQTFLEGFRAFRESGGALQDRELDYVRKDGTLLPVLLTTTATFDAHGRFSGSRTVVTDNSVRKQLERERTTHSARLADLSRHMVDVQENERRKLAGELHDRASPNLAALQLTLSNIARALPPPVLVELQPLLEDAQALLLDTTTGIRDICTDLRPATLDYAGLIPALHDYAQQFGRRTGIACSSRRTASTRRCRRTSSRYCSASPRKP